MPTKLNGWERLVIILGVIISLPPLAFLLLAAYSVIFMDNPEARLGIIVSVTALVIIWVLTYGLLWIIRGFKQT